MSSLTILRSCYYDMFAENMSAEYNQIRLKENYFITGLENKLRNIRRKYKTHGRTKIIVWTMCYQFTSYQFEEILWAFIKTNLDFADQGKRRSQRLDSKNRLKNQFRKLVSRSDSKVLSFENELVRKVIVTTSGKDSTRRITRHASLDYNVNENEIL